LLRAADALSAIEEISMGIPYPLPVTKQGLGVPALMIEGVV